MRAALYDDGMRLLGFIDVRDPAPEEWFLPSRHPNGFPGTIKLTRRTGYPSGDTIYTCGVLDREAAQRYRGLKSEPLPR